MTVARGQLLIDQYRRTFEGDEEVMLHQLLGDLIEWCDAKSIDLGLALEDAREMVREAS